MDYPQVSQAHQSSGDRQDICRVSLSIQTDKDIDRPSLAVLCGVPAYLRLVWTTLPTEASPAPQLATSTTCIGLRAAVKCRLTSTASRLRLKYWPTMRLAASRTSPAPSPAVQ